MKKRYMVTLLTVALGGCASVSEPISFGDGVYQLNAAYSIARGGSEGALRAIIKESHDFCGKKGKRAVIDSSGEGGYGQASIQFTCR